jgi:hypothetical protein
MHSATDGSTMAEVKANATPLTPPLEHLASLSAALVAIKGGTPSVCRQALHFGLTILRPLFSSRRFDFAAPSHVAVLPSETSRTIPRMHPGIFTMTRRRLISS